MRPEDQATGEVQNADPKAGASRLNLTAAGQNGGEPTDLNAPETDAAATGATAAVDQAGAADADKADQTDAATGAEGAEEPAAPVLDHVRIRALVDEIENTAAAHTIEDLVHRLQQEEGLVIGEVEKEAGVIRLELAGIAATTRATGHRVLTNWCNAARRALIQAGL